MIITSLNDAVTWHGTRWDVHTVAESTTCTIRVLKVYFKRCPVMSRPLHLCASEKLHISHNDGCLHFATEGSVMLSNMALIMPS